MFADYYVIKNLQNLRYIVKEIPKKTRDLFETFKIPFPKKQIKD